MDEHARIQFELAKATTREEVLGLALGAASTCWESMEGTGEFDSSEARRILQDTSARLSELDEPFLGLASTAELITELAARYNTFQFQLGQAFTDFLNYKTAGPHE